MHVRWPSYRANRAPQCSTWSNRPKVQQGATELPDSRRPLIPLNSPERANKPNCFPQDVLRLRGQVKRRLSEPFHATEPRLGLNSHHRSLLREGPTSARRKLHIRPQMLSTSVISALLQRATAAKAAQHHNHNGKEPASASTVG